MRPTLIEAEQRAELKSVRVCLWRSDLTDHLVWSVEENKEAEPNPLALQRDVRAYIRGRVRRLCA